MHKKTTIFMVVFTLLSFHYIIPNSINPIVFIAKLANICTNQDVYILLLFSLRKLNITPPIKRPDSVIINTGKENQPVIIAMWYIEKQSALK